MVLKIEKKNKKTVFHTYATQAVLWKVLSCTCFAVISGLVHALAHFSEKLPPCEIAFFQTGLATFFLWLFWFKQFTRVESLILRQPFLALARAFCLALGVSLWFTALQYLPLADIAAFKLLSPLIVMLSARLVLKEPLSPSRFFALGGCLIGAGILFQKEFSKGWQGEGHIAFWAILLPLGALIAYAASTLLAKRLLKKDNPQKVTFSLLILATPLLGICASFEWITPSVTHLPFLGAVGFLSGIAYYSLNKALECADITYLMPFGLTRFVVSTVLAYLVFGETLGLPALSGAVLIVLTSFWLLRTEAKKELTSTVSPAVFNP